jgi:hypothetical protein
MYMNRGRQVNSNIGAGRTRTLRMICIEIEIATGIDIMNDSQRYHGT